MFKKGDIVKIIKESSIGWKGVGLTGEIIQVQKSDNKHPYQVEFLNGTKSKDNHSYGWYAEGDIKLAVLNRKLRVGDKVEFIPDDKYVPKYYTDSDGIPLSLIKCGGTILGDKYNKNKAKIVDTYKEYLIVEYICNDDRITKLGFKAESLKLIKSNNKSPTHIILWNNVYHIVYSRKEIDEKIKELVDDKDVDNDDIIIYDIKNKSKVSCEVIIEEIK